MTNYLNFNTNNHVIKYKNLSNYGNLWMIIHIDIYFFVTLYKREIPLMKIHLILFLHSNFSFLFSSPFTLLFYNTLSTRRSEYIENTLSIYKRRRILEMNNMYCIIMIFIYFIS